jgi:hypothetical protein
MTEARLHPRLSRAYAVIRWDALKDADPEAARAQRASTLPDEVTWTATGAPRITSRELGDLREALVKSVDDLPFGEALSAVQRDTFDTRVTRVYAEHASLFPAEAANLEIWSYHALVLVPDLALWRWRHMDRPNVERFVGVDLTRHTYGRLWWRWYTFTSGQLADDVGWELLEGLREADLDQLQSRRNAYGVDPPIVRALAEIYLEVKARSAEEGLASRPVWRDLLKRLLRRGAFVAFGAMQPDALATAARQQLDIAISALHASDGSETTAAAAASWPSFDVVPLSHLVVAVTEAVEATGTLSDAALPAAVQAKLGVDVPGRFRSAIGGFAWMAATLGYLRRDESTERWRLGVTQPAPDNRWAAWTVSTIRAAAAGNGGVDDDFIGRVFAGRPGKTVKRMIRAAAASNPP